MRFLISLNVKHVILLTHSFKLFPYSDIWYQVVLNRSNLLPNPSKGVLSELTQLNCYDGFFSCLPISINLGYSCYSVNRTTICNILHEPPPSMSLHNAPPRFTTTHQDPCNTQLYHVPPHPVYNKIRINIGHLQFTHSFLLNHYKQLLCKPICL